ncbi:hypothetical protein TanjilG_07766 [Lupinus angustifolius]|uniref:RING-type domain-containing protein n=1 Tax=Lupinus angustifolius TaxID=3871 RepID=A0A1J7HK39_LUPAN|nr:PREDICTED: RING-H2 finger protein ATL70-like [Lupinus angustifolius]OIW13160.1 hypothetical protein TanjilG_07766 [Lupinus angustifolius]
MNNTSNSENPSGESNLSHYSAALCVGFLLLITLMALTAHCCSHRNLQNTQSTRTIAMDRDISDINIQVLGEEEFEAIVKNYPVLLYSQAKLENSSSILSCTICLADYKDSEWLRFLPDCGHYFHKDCIDIWLRVNMSCPVCRKSLFTTPIAEVATLATGLD